jgi:hypothetical protein
LAKHQATTNLPTADQSHARASELKKSEEQQNMQQKTGVLILVSLMFLLTDIVVENYLVSLLCTCFNSLLIYHLSHGNLWQIVHFTEPSL